MKKKITNNITNYPLDLSRCAPCVKKGKSTKTCYSKRSLEIIAREWNKHNPSSSPIPIVHRTTAQLWSAIQKKMVSECGDDEYCWKKQKFIKQLRDAEIDYYTFKHAFPKEWFRNKYTWLNTYDIYYVMKQYTKKDPEFEFFGPIPSDCPIKINCELSKFNIMNMKKNKIFKIGIIYNLDVSSGDGTHWVAVYIDNKNNEINYFDSYGSMPTPLIRDFIQKVADNYEANGITPKVIYNDKRFQYGHSECGVYSMNFILERIHGTTMYDLTNLDIPDENMNYLRNVLYLRLEEGEGKKKM